MAVGLIGLLAGFGLLSMRGGLTSADSHSLALVALEQFRLARQSAVSNQTPTAVVIPSDQGSRPLAQSLYIATGSSMARVSQAVNYSKDHRNACLFVGTWALGAGSFSINPPQVGQPSNAFNVTAWLTNPNSTYLPQKDYAFVFLPDGSLTTNGVPFSSATGAYYVVASAGATYAAAAPPGGPTSPGPDDGVGYFAALSVARAWTISLTPHGEIALSSGLPGATGVPNTDSMAISGVATPPNVGPVPAPNIQCALPGGIQIQPTITDTSGLPTGVNTTIAPGKHVTLAANCTDSSGSDVYIGWTATPSSANDPATSPSAGNFSITSAQRMTWDAQAGLWKSSTDWLCPQNSVPGDQWTFTPSFGPSPQAVVPNNGLAQDIVAVRQPQIWAWVSAPGVNWGPGTYFLMKSNLDGTGQQTVMSRQVPYSHGTDECFSVSEDGNTYVATTDSGFISGTQGGKDIANVTIANFGQPNTVKISPKGDKVIYASGAGKRVVRICNIDGSHPTVIYSDAVGSPPSWGAPPGGADEIDGAVWSADSSHVALAARNTINNQGTVWYMNADGSGRSQVTNYTFTSSIPRLDFDKTGQYLHIARQDLDSESHRWDTATHSMEAAAFSATSTNYLGSATRQFTPDNSRIYFLDWSGRNLYYQNNTALAPVNQVPFTLPTDPVLGAGRLLAFGISRF